MEEITRKQQLTTETASSEKRREPYVENTMFNDDDSAYNTRAHIPEYFPIPRAQEEKGYPGWLSKSFKKIQGVTYSCLQPVFTVLRFLNEKTNLAFWIILSIVIGILVGCFAPSAGVAATPLVIGIAGHGDDISKVGTLATKPLL